MQKAYPETSIPICKVSFHFDFRFWRCCPAERDARPSSFFKRHLEELNKRKESARFIAQFGEIYWFVLFPSCWSSLLACRVDLFRLSFRFNEDPRKARAKKRLNLQKSLLCFNLKLFPETNLPAPNSPNQCIRLKNISLRVRRPIVSLMDEIGANSALLDVFVIGTNAQEQLSRFFKLTNILNGQQDLIKLSNRMELLQFDAGQSAKSSIIKTEARGHREDELISNNKENEKKANEHDDDDDDDEKENTKSNSTSDRPQRARESCNDSKPMNGSKKLSPIYLRLRRSLREFGRISDEAKLETLLAIYEKISSIQAKTFRAPDLRGSSGKNLHLLDAIHLLIKQLSLQQEQRAADQQHYDDHQRELLSILCRQEFHSVCQAFDCIRARLIKRDSTSVSANSSPTNQTHSEGETNSKRTTTTTTTTTLERVVCIQKNSNQALGATIKNDSSGRVLIGRIIFGGVAHTSGLLNEGDELLEVNGVPLIGMDINQVIELLNDMDDSLVFRIKAKQANGCNSQGRPVDSKAPGSSIDGHLFVKTHFDFDPERQDEFVVPCKELALSFAANEILHVIDQSDRNWWQAKRVADVLLVNQHHLPGLIPSLEHLSERQKQSNLPLNRQTDPIQMEANSRKSDNLVLKLLFNCPRGNSPKRRKSQQSSMIQISQQQQCDPMQRCFYEQVIQVQPGAQLRPIFLFGPKLIGQNELIRKLLQSDSKYSTAISHTSRPIKSNEIHGVDFHFVTRTEFELKINRDEFIEFGLYQNHYYGTSIESIKQVVSSGKICVQLVNLASILSLRNGRAGRQLKPIFVFVKPDVDRPDRLRNVVVQSTKRRLNLDERIRSIWTEVELIEANYLASFDLTLTMSDAQEGYESLVRQLNELRSRGQWIPIHWQQQDNSNSSSELTRQTNLSSQ